MSLLAGIGAIVAAVTTVTKALAIAGMAVQGLKAVGGIFMSIAKALGLLKPELKPEDLGDKAIQSGYNPEDYDSYEEYVKDVEKYETDPERSKQITEEQKLQKGIELAIGLAVEKFQDFPIQDFCIMAGQNPDFFTEAKMGELTKLMQSDGQCISGILNFANGSEKDSAKLKNAVGILTGLEKKTNPSISDMQATKNVMALRK